MPWCPKCKAEYREGYSICTSCQVYLVNELPAIEETIHETNEECEAFLFTAADNIQADMVESLLRAYHIPVLKKHRGIGNYLQIYWGFTKLGTDLFVPTKSLAEAQDILRDCLEKKEEDILENDEPEMRRIYKKERAMRNWVVFACFLLSDFGIILALLIYLFFKLFNRRDYCKA